MTNFTNFKYADCMDEKCPYCYSQNIEGYETDDLVTAEFSGSTAVSYTHLTLPTNREV